MKNLQKNGRGVRSRLQRTMGRRGAAVVEFAVISPVLVAMLFGIIEYGWRLMVRQTMVQASQVGARTATLPGSTDDEIRDNVLEHLTAAGLADSIGASGIQITHGTPGNPAETVTLTVAVSDVSLVGFFGTSGTMTTSSVMYK